MGSNANAGRVVYELSTLVVIESYAPADNVAELSARANDVGGPVGFLGGSRLEIDASDCLSVGGGDKNRGSNANLCDAIDFGESVGAKFAGTVGCDDGYTARKAEVYLVVPTVNPEIVTLYSEGCHVVIC